MNQLQPEPINLRHGDVAPSRLRQYCQLSHFRQFPACPRAERGGGRDCLKMNSAQMKTTELQMLWKLVKAGEDRPLTAADLALLLRIRYAVQEYEAAMCHNAEAQGIKISLN
jgi:hypothetical protein